MFFAHSRPWVSKMTTVKGREGRGKERKRKGKAREGKERKGKERQGKGREGKARQEGGNETDLFHPRVLRRRCVYCRRRS